MSSIDAETEKRPVIRINVSDPTLLLIPACASTLGFVSGLLQSGQKASLQFLAENAHRQPTTLQGWYFYNKTKNYRVALAAARGGLRTAFKLGAWTGAFVGVKEYATRFGYNNAQGGALSGLSMALGATYLCPSIGCIALRS